MIWQDLSISSKHLHTFVAPSFHRTITGNYLTLQMTTEKRKASASPTGSGCSPSKIQRFLSPEEITRVNAMDLSCNGQELVVSENEATDWPAPRGQISAAQEFIRECVEGNHLTLLVPDKDADGLSSGKILHATLTSLGHPPSLVNVHLLSKCASIFHASERIAMESHNATRVIILDQGSRGSPPLVSPYTRTDPPLPVKVLIIDHHESTYFPSNSLIVSGCRASPVPTASMISYAVCCPLLQDKLTRDTCAAYAVLGVYGDLGTSGVKWGSGPWPGEFAEVVKREKKTVLGKVVGLVNAPRRTDTFNVNDAWNAILDASSPSSLLTSSPLLAARARVNSEIERVANNRAAPRFSKDGRVALIKIHSAFQVHPVIAIRWAGRLAPKAGSKSREGRRVEMVMVSNDAYHPSGQHTNFSCRAVVQSKGNAQDSQRSNLIEMLLEYAREIPDSETFFQNVGGDFARGHKEASGGIIPTVEFEELVDAMEIGVKDERSSHNIGTKGRGKKVTIDSSQTTRLTSYFKKL